MAGLLLPVFPKRIFDFGSLPIGSAQVLPIADRIDISKHIDCLLVVRFHSGDLTGGQIVFDLYLDGYTPEDPALQFRQGPAFTTFIGFNGIFPDQLVYGGTVHGQYAAIQVTGSRILAGAFNAAISMDMVLRSPDDL